MQCWYINFKKKKKRVTAQDTGSQYKHPFFQSTKLKTQGRSTQGGEEAWFRYFFAATTPFWSPFPSKHLRIYFAFLQCNVSVDNFSVIPLQQITGLSNLQGSDDRELTRSRCTKEVLNVARPRAFPRRREGAYLGLSHSETSREVTGTWLCGNMYHPDHFYSGRNQRSQKNKKKKNV